MGLLRAFCAPSLAEILAQCYGQREPSRESFPGTRAREGAQPRAGEGTAWAEPGRQERGLRGEKQPPPREALPSHVPRQGQQTHQDLVSLEVPVQLLKVPELLLGGPGKATVTQTNGIESAGSHLGRQDRESRPLPPPAPLAGPPSATLPGSSPATLDPLVYLSVPTTWAVTGTPGANTSGCAL